MNKQVFILFKNFNNDAFLPVRVFHTSKAVLQWTANNPIKEKKVSYLCKIVDIDDQ